MPVGARIRTFAIVKPMTAREAKDGEVHLGARIAHLARAERRPIRETHTCGANGLLLNGMRGMSVFISCFQPFSL